MSPNGKIVSIDDRGRAYIAKLGFDRGTTLVADRLAGDELAWVIRQGRVVTELELSVLADAEALESMIRAGQESTAGVDTIELA